MPIRCGLNAVAWHRRRGKAVEHHLNYHETLKAAVCREAPLALGMYDHAGASLPVLFEAFKAHPNEDVFAADQKAVLRLMEGLEALASQANDRRFIHLYSDIEHLAGDLRGQTICAVLGGGAWLASHDGEVCNVVSHIPSKSRGYLWIEGAAVVAGTPVKPDDLREFLKSTVLSYRYQRELMRGHPYGCSPVISDLVRHILKEDEALEEQKLSEAERSICTETRAIYDGDDIDALSERVKLRLPPDHPELWHNCWQQIKTQYCKTVRLKETAR